MSSKSIREVLQEELEQVETSRRLRLDKEMPRRAPAQHSLIGLAFSGGGIRSATFNLGVLQALAQAHVLRAFDYVSTVSGGGYIGSWLMAWMHHQRIGIRQIEERLARKPYSTANAADPPELHFLRNYSNYLTPRKGILGADFWAFLASYLRNTFLNQTILVLSLLALLLLPRALVYVPHVLEAEEAEWAWRIPFTQQLLTSQISALGVGLLLGLIALVFIGLNLFWVDVDNEDPYPWFTQQWAVQVCVVLPLIVAASLFAYSAGHFLQDWGILEDPFLGLALLGAVFYGGLWALALFVRWIAGTRRGSAGPARPAVWRVLVTAAATGALLGYLFLPYAKIVIPAGSGPGATYDLWRVFTFGTAGFVGIMLLAGVLHIGLMGRSMLDAHREWWGRLGGWILIYSIGWLSLFLIAIYAPVGLARLWDISFQRKYTFTTGTLVWVLSTLYGILFGKSEATTGELKPNTPTSKMLLGYIARLTPYIFVLGLLLALSVLAAWIANALAGNPFPLSTWPSDIVDPLVPVFCGLFVVAALVLSWRVDINEFSVHHLYRNRLIRCYLGASAQHRDRDAQPFTGFSESDDLLLTKLQVPLGSEDPKDGRPLPILNTSLNVVRGKELALQTRKARSFAFTPLYAGFTREVAETTAWRSAYASTKDAGDDRPESKGGTTLGTAVAISGAAASPNMGSYSSPPLAFLMTLFDVRLGWWVGNPARPKGWRRGSPVIGFFYLLRELLGSTNDDSKYVYLSDGGHFENLAVYELVRRGCRLIVACDASCDSGYGFGDLHNAIERCRTDFGVEIEVDTSELKHDDGLSRSHFAVGKIHYAPGSSRGEDLGVLIYLKPALLADDPADVLGYKVTNPHFPHDTTANQWFDEAHFENYRALGEAAGSAACGTIADKIRGALGQGGA
ncbi:MAG: patatin-like phospholipase family protein [Acidobacteriia bacterium]|nr:patatin-like phospholipase family protein [Terriglobia bacterium]